MTLKEVFLGKEADGQVVPVENLVVVNDTTATFTTTAWASPNGLVDVIAVGDDDYSTLTDAFTYEFEPEPTFTVAVRQV